MTEDNDGISLTTISHPKPKSLRSKIYWWFRSLRGPRKSAIETVEIEISKPTKGFQIRNRAR